MVTRIIPAPTAHSHRFPETEKSARRPLLGFGPRSSYQGNAHKPFENTKAADGSKRNQQDVDKGRKKPDVQTAQVIKKPGRQFSAAQGMH
jgi:hypothetical protein